MNNDKKDALMVGDGFPKFLYGKIAKVYGIFPKWQSLQEICNKNLLPPRHLPFNYEKVKVRHGKLNNCHYWRPMINLTQFTATIRAKHYTQ